MINRNAAGVLALLALAGAQALAAPRTDNFNISVAPDGSVLSGGGSGFDNGTWFEYPDTGWLNQWFYDHPFDPSRWKEIHIEFDAAALTPGAAGSLDFAVNWSTPDWNAVPGHETTPPIPGFPGFFEGIHIERFIFLDADQPDPMPIHYTFDYIISGYNPEWVSIDVRGFNFEITNGVIIHDCVPAPAAAAPLAIALALNARRRR
jgi:hypothetical protein